MMDVCVACVSAGPQRTSPTVPKNMPPPQRALNSTPAIGMRKHAPLMRNGGSDAEIMELNQQVSKHTHKHAHTHIHTNTHTNKHTVTHMHSMHQIA